MNRSLFATHGGRPIPSRANSLLPSPYSPTYTKSARTFAMPPTTRQTFIVPIFQPSLTTMSGNHNLPSQPFVWIVPDTPYNNRLEIILISILILVSLDLIFVRPQKSFRKD